MTLKKRATETVKSDTMWYRAMAYIGRCFSMEGGSEGGLKIPAQYILPFGGDQRKFQAKKGVFLFSKLPKCVVSAKTVPLPSVASEATLS